MIHGLNLYAALRRLAPTLLVALGGALSALQGAHAFGFDDVAAQARERAAAPYREPAATPMARWLAGLSYDQYRSIRYRPDQAVWRHANLPFELQFFHVGRNHQRALRLYEIVDGRAQALAVPRDAFDYGGQTLPTHAGDAAEIAGFRVHFALNSPRVKDEVIALLGASYFRAVGAGQHYGLSARGIAVDTTGGRREEFPAFDTLWIERPASDAAELTFYALLDGPRVTGAYRFVVRPGSDTVVDVHARLFLREQVATLGIAPLTSMFLHGENQPSADDYRPEVHDSDGLQIAAGDGEWIWRPLVNPKGVFVTSFALQRPRGFGLMQRDRAFVRYEDLEARYERRPSAWVEPLPGLDGTALEAWRAGRVELLQFHTPDETHDNIGAFWVPARQPAPGEAFDVAWRLRWQGDAAIRSPGAHVVQTRAGVGYREGAIERGRMQLHLDVDGPALRSLPAATEVEAVVTAGGNAERLRAHAYANPATGGWRVSIEFFRPDHRQAVELRAFLRAGDRVLSETWSYALPPS
jgi:glucans biosynthesis protein